MTTNYKPFTIKFIKDKDKDIIDFISRAESIGLKKVSIFRVALRLLIKQTNNDPLKILEVMRSLSEGNK